MAKLQVPDSTCEICQLIIYDNLEKLIYAIENYRYYKGLAADGTDAKLWKVLEEVKGEL